MISSVRSPARKRCTGSAAIPTSRNTLMKKFLLLILLAGLPLYAQTDRATITGAVIDPSGRRISGADVDVTSASTGLTRHAQTNEAGLYTVTSLNTGTYTVKIQAPGFSAYKTEAISLDVGQTRTLDAKLTMRGTTEQVTVTDSGLSKSSAEIGGVVHGNQARDLSLNGRSFVGL